MLYAMLTLLCGFGTGTTLRTALSFPESPVEMNLAEVPGKLDSGPLWALLRGVKWQCTDKLVEYDSDGQPEETIPVVSEAGHLLAVFDPLHHDIPCEELRTGDLIGTIEPIGDRRLDYLSDRQFPIVKQFARTEIFQICGGCGPDDSKLGVLLLGSLTILLAAATFVYFRNWKKELRADHRS